LNRWTRSSLAREFGAYQYQSLPAQGVGGDEADPILELKQALDREQ
jgi:hypothetical protein